MSADMPGKYESGADMWREYKEQYGDIEARGICNRYLDLQIRTTDPEELEFCRELFAAMQKDPIIKPVTEQQKESVLAMLNRAQESGKVKNHEKIAPQGLMSFDDFISKCRVLDEACRQWCAFIDEYPERRDGNLFTEFFNDICRQKYQEYLDDPVYREDCNYFASLSDEDRYNMVARESMNTTRELPSRKQADKPSILEQLQQAKVAATKPGTIKEKKPPGMEI